MPPPAAIPSRGWLTSTFDGRSVPKLALLTIAGLLVISVVAWGGGSAGDLDRGLVVVAPTTSLGGAARPVIATMRAPTRGVPDQPRNKVAATVPTVGGNEFDPHDWAWLKRHALKPSSDASGYTLELTDAAFNAVNDGVIRKKQSKCPDRYVFVNTHTFGRHHNQLQEMLNLVAWGRTLNRTAVLGWFRINHKWVDATSVYNFSLIFTDYCAISSSEFLRVWRSGVAGQTDRSAACIGQGINDTPLKGVVRRCRLQPDVPAYYSSRHGVSASLPYLTLLMRSSPLAESRFVGVGGQLAFFMRPGLLEQVAVTSRLLPSDDATKNGGAFARSHKLRILTRGGRSPSASEASKDYFALHLRQREKECGKEMNYTFEDGGAMVTDISQQPVRSFIEGQCGITVTAFDALYRSVVGPTAPAFFLASDRQNQKLEAALRDRGAVMFDGPAAATPPSLLPPGLLDLTIDFFLLQSGRFFAGNQLSSISQNVCFSRLGRGLPCNGFVTDFTLFHSRVTDKAAFEPNFAWPSGEVTLP